MDNSRNRASDGADASPGKEALRNGPAALPRAPLVHVTTVHSRHDVRIFRKEVRTLGAAFDRKAILIVADGLGDEQEQQGRIHIVDAGPLGSGRLRRALQGSWRALRAILRLKPALVHFHDPELIPMSLLLKALGYTIVYDVHEDVPAQILGKYWISPPLRRAVSRATSAVEGVAKLSFDAFVTATPQIARTFPPGRTTVVQNYPIQAELIAPGAISYAQRPLNIAYVGGISADRGGREMIQAMALLPADPKTTLELAGSCMPASLEAELRLLPGSDRVAYRGQIDRPTVATLLGSSRVGLVVYRPMPNHIEAQPNKLFEYMAAGLPVIASDFPLWRTIVEGAGCGLLVDPTDPQAIAEAITWIFDHPAEAEAMGRRGQAMVAETYNWANEASKLVQLYTKLLAPIDRADA